LQAAALPEKSLRFSRHAMAMTTALLLAGGAAAMALQ
jgi:hypothetical protein